MVKLLKKCDDLEVMILGLLVVIIVIVIVIIIVRPNSTANNQPIQFWRTQFAINSDNHLGRRRFGQLSGAPFIIKEPYTNYKAKRYQSNCGCS